jgi:hypothetical protein
MANNAELDSKLVENQQAPTVHFEMGVNEVNIIFAALQELPHRVADPVLRKLMEQAQAQLTPAG